MTTSNLYDFDPSAGELVIAAFARIGVRRTEILASHLADARMAANLVMSEFSNKQPNLWTVSLTTLPLVAGTATYTLSAEMVVITDLYLNDGSTDSILAPITRSEYSAIPDKTLQSTPTQYWFNKQTTPTITFWPVPAEADTVYYYAVRRNQDVEYPVGLTIDVPFRFLDAFVAALAWRLAEIYRPEVEQAMAAKAERAWKIAAAADVEEGNIYILPQLAGYWS